MIEILGFIMFLIGAGGMDSTGKGYVIAIIFVLVGMFLMFVGGAITDTLERKRRRRKYERTGEI